MDLFEDVGLTEEEHAAFEAGVEPVAHGRRAHEQLRLDDDLAGLQRRLLGRSVAQQQVAGRTGPSGRRTTTHSRLG